MGSIKAKSFITKNRILPLIETFLYWFLEASIVTSNSLDCTNFSEIYIEVSLESSKVVIKFTSSRIVSALASANNFKIDFSESSIFFLN